MNQISLALLLGLSLVACGRQQDETANARVFETRGIVRGFSPNRETIEIEHENIRGFMPQMTMPFSARDQKQIAQLAMGDAISFQLHVSAKDAWIDNLKQIRREDVALAQTVAPPAKKFERLREGDSLPSFSLTNQNGEQIAPENFRGHPFVLTFIFTRCPLPSFCPRMSQNFFALQEANAGAHLLSITLDPAFDTPQVLKQYSDYLHADPATWNFATGDSSEIDRIAQAFSVYREIEGGTISHGLATALIDSQGKIVQIWRGNSWKTTEVIDAIASLRN